MGKYTLVSTVDILYGSTGPHGHGDYNDQRKRVIGFTNGNHNGGRPQKRAERSTFMQNRLKRGKLLATDRSSDLVHAC